MLEERHPLVQKYYDKLSRSLEVGIPEGQTGWVEDTIDYLDGQGRPWWINAHSTEAYSSGLVDLFPGLAELTPRQWEAAVAHGLDPNNLPEHPPRLLNFAMDVNRISVRKAEDGCRLLCPTFTPGCVHFHTGRVRKLLGVEGMLLQGPG